MLLDWVFRPQCAACGAAARTLCDACRGSLVELGPACPRCGEPTVGEATSGEAMTGEAVTGEVMTSEPTTTQTGEPTTTQTGEPTATPPGEPHSATTSDRSTPTASAPSTGAPSTSSARCLRCLRWPLPLDRVIAPWRFGGALGSAIRRLKFADRVHIARDLAPLWAPVLAAAVAEADAIVVAVPLHWRRRARRGYDHAWLLARHACKLAGLAPPVCALRRTRHGPAQSTLAAAERAANVEGAFAVTRKAALVSNRAVILVDDVMTTGATLAAAARPLRAAGATSITAVVLARATSARG